MEQCALAKILKLVLIILKFPYMDHDENVDSLCSFCHTHTFFIIQYSFVLLLKNMHNNIQELFLMIYLYFLQPTQSSFSTTTDYSTTSFKDAKIQYRPYGSYKYHKAEEEAEDVPMPMIDIQLPFNNHSHIVTWLDPDKMSPKLNRDVFQVCIPKPIFCQILKIVALASGTTPTVRSAPTPMCLRSPTCTL